ncbi:Importin N-terminal domain-containing protein [Entamoeba marina]
MQDTPAIITLLQTLNSNCDSTVRKNAENMLLSSLPQSILPLLQIATDPSIDTNARLLAAIVCKNHILSNPLPENDIITCINAVMPSLPNCPHRISVMLSFFLEALTRNHASSRIALIRQSSQQLPSTLNVLDALLCYTFINSDELSILCEKDGVCDKLLNCVESHCDPIAMKIIGGIVPFIGVEESNSFAVMVIQRVPISIINVLNGDSLLGWYHALQLLRIISSDAPHIVEENFEKLLNKVMDVTQKVIELQQQNQWQTLDVVSDLPYDIKDGILIGLVDVFSVFASLDLYRKRNIQKVGDIATSVVRLLCSPTQDWYFPFDCLSHTAAQNVQQTSSSTLAEAGIIFLHNIILYQTLPVNVLFVSSFQLLQQGAALLQSHKRNFVNYRGTGLLILTVCGDYLSKAQVHIQKEVNAIIIDVVRTDFQLLDTISYDDFIEHDICYALACITSILPSATYNDLTFFLSALMSSYSKLLQDVVVLPFTLRLLTKCLSIPDFTISPYFTSFFSLVLNSLNVSNDELPYVFDTLSAYCQHLSSAAGTLTQTLVAALLRCFLQNPISPNVRHSLIQIFTILFKNRPLFLRVMEYLMPPLPTVYAFCSRQSNDYSTQTALLLTLLIVKYSMALGEGLIHLVMLALSAGRTTTSCLSISVQLASAIMQKYVNIMDTQEGQTIVSTILQNIDEAVKIGLLENEEMVKDSCSVLLLMSIFHGEKLVIV